MKLFAVILVMMMGASSALAQELEVPAVVDSVYVMEITVVPAISLETIEPQMSSLVLQDQAHAEQTIALSSTVPAAVGVCSVISAMLVGFCDSNPNASNCQY